MELLLILPYDTTYRYKSAFVRPLSYQPLTLSMLAALVPGEANAHITLVDEGVQQFDYSNRHYDVVGISVCTSSANRGYELADFFRKKGSHVLIGGHHATLLPKEAALHADTVFMGSAEKTFPRFFRDYLAGVPKTLYESIGVDATRLPIPRRDLMPKKGYIKQATIIADYGCGNHCAYCVIPPFWGSRAQQPVEQVIDEMLAIGAKEYLFLDPSPICDKTYVKELFEAIAQLNIKWAGLATLDVAEDDELLYWLEKSGCVGTLLGFETFSQKDLDSLGKYQNKARRYREVVAKLHSHGIAVQGTFMLGLDGDTRQSLYELPYLIDSAKIDVPSFSILTPFPATPLFEQLKSQGRILHEDWRLYDTVHCVFKPANMPAKLLEQEFLHIWRKTYAAHRIIKRLVHTPQKRYAALVTSLGFRVYAERLRGLL